MTNNSRKRLIWEEIMRDPDIYRVCEAGSSSNSYVFFSGEDVVVIDMEYAASVKSGLSTCSRKRLR